MRLSLLLTLCSLISCGPVQAPPTLLAPSAAPAWTATLKADPTARPTASLAPQAVATASESPAIAPTHQPLPTATPSPSATNPPVAPTAATPVVMPRPTLPPLRPAALGEALPLSLGWQFSANGHLTGGAVATWANQPTFLLSSLGRSVYALSENGKLRWQARMSGPVYAVALLDDERIAAGDDAGHVDLLDSQGRRLWRHALGSRVTALLGGWQGGLLAGGWDERLSFLRVAPEGERVVWQAGLQGPVSAIAGLPDLALVATLDGQVSAFDPTGGQAWRHDAGSPVTSLGTIERGIEPLVLVALQDGRLQALGPDGVLRWEVALGASSTGSPVWSVADLEGDGSAEIVAGLGGGEPLLAALSTDGELLWRVGVPAAVNALASLDLDGDGRPEILSGLSSGEVQAYDSQGRLRASVQAGLPVWGLVPTDDAVLVLADVVAWRVQATPGKAGGPWLPPPAMLPTAPEILPGSLDRAGAATLVFLGDVSPGRSMEFQLARYGPGYPWTQVEPLLGGADLVVANLEGLLTTQGRPLNKSYLIRAHPRWGKTLVEAGLGLVHLANNHALDFGETGLDETLATLEALDIDYVGAGRKADDASSPRLYDINGVRVAILGYAAARWEGSTDVPRTGRVAWAKVGAVEADVRAVREQADLVVVLLHAGTEYATLPSPDQVAVAHAAVEAGADLVVGHHPHVTQTVERYGAGLIVYSLGDAVFDIPRPAAMRGHLLRVDATKDGLGRAELWPFWIEDAIRPRFVDDGQGAPRVRSVYP